jgi:hypothetical protein
LFKLESPLREFLESLEFHGRVGHADRDHHDLAVLGLAAVRIPRRDLAG